MAVPASIYARSFTNFKFLNHGLSDSINLTDGNTKCLYSNIRKSIDERRLICNAAECALQMSKTENASVKSNWSCANNIECDIKELWDDVLWKNTAKTTISCVYAPPLRHLDIAKGPLIQKDNPCPIGYNRDHNGMCQESYY